MDHDDLTLFQSGCDLRVGGRAVTDLYLSEVSAPALNDEQVPAISRAEQGAARNRKNILAFPDHDPDVDTKVVAERGLLVDKLCDDVDALCFDTQRRNLSYRLRFDRSHLRAERFIGANVDAIYRAMGGMGLR